MSFNVTLGTILGDILHVINPSNEDWSARFRILDELRTVVQSVESLRGATVEPFGSFVSNIFTRWGDLDITVELSNGSYILAAGKKRKQTLLGELLKALRRKGAYRRLQFIANARVPILKFESINQNISCDISINNLNGQMKSKILYWINDIDGRFRDLVLLVKEWAKAHDINDSKSGTLNSYSLSLLVIFHLQTCVPSILPPLKEIYPGNMVDDLIGVRAAAETHIEGTCAEGIASYKANRSKVPNRSSLSELFISFFAKFSNIGLWASGQGICPYTGQLEEIDGNMRWLPKTYALYVEDPFDKPMNTARTVSERQMMRISEAFQTTHLILTSVNQNRNSLVATLVRPQIVSPVIARTPSGNPSYSARSTSQMQRNVQLPSQLQQRFQSMTLNGRPNNLTIYRPVQMSHGQNQQVQRHRFNR